MGFFNAMSSIGKMNNLLTETEKQLKLISFLLERDNANCDRLQMAINYLNELKMEMCRVLEKSSSARVATYTFLGRKSKALEMLLFLHKTIQELNNR